MQQGPIKLREEQQMNEQPNEPMNKLMNNKRNEQHGNLKVLTGISFNRIHIEDGFWSPKLQINKDVTIKACLDMCEKTGRISNFDKAAGRMDGEFSGIYFNDSDVYKVLEGAAYSLMNNPDHELESYADEIIDKIAAAQQEDGYLNTYFTLAAPDKRWTDMERHEDYCAGHLIEAAVAYYKATGKRKFLDVACRLSDHMYNVFIEGKRHWVVGHQEPELALVKLYHVSGDERYLQLAWWFLEERGRGYGVGEGIWGKTEWGPKYCQDDKPVGEMSDIGGHAVRAVYMYTGMADVAAVTGDRRYIEALDRLWSSTVNRNMYITGGIGSSKENEGFTEDYDLPNDSAYCETCASVGMVYWNHRMNLLHRKGIYADVLERSMYNGALAGVSLDGKKFFYVNPLMVKGEHNRQEWYDCSCCPTQISRFIPSIGNYVYAADDNSIYTNLYISGTADIALGNGRVKLTQNTRYPWEGSVNITVEPLDITGFGMKLRFPGWCRSCSVKINNTIVHDIKFRNGYISLEREWASGDSVTLEFDMPVEMVHADPRVKANQGRTAIQRGPLVYCFEELDNSKELDSIVLGSDVKFFTEYRPGFLGGVIVIHVQCGEKTYTAVPYYAWNNRGSGGMQVWMKEA